VAGKALTILILEFVQKMSDEFRDHYTLNIFYMSLLRPKLGSSV
jgi:hypothetical protein